MALIKCPECDNEFSDTVNKCPKCGFKISKNKKTKIKILIIIIAIIIITVLSIFLVKPYIMYLRGIELINKQKYEEAINILGELGDYKNANDKAQEAKRKYNEENPATLSGLITYKYNNFVGNRGDTGAIVVAVNTDIHEPEKYEYNKEIQGENGKYIATVDGKGNYKMTDLPSGNYAIFIVSRNCTGESFKNTEQLLQEFKDVELAEIKTKTILGLGKSICFENIYLKPNETKELSYDFGINLF